ncbi:hypothetical protein CYLTODRAFT_491152 [Cylindrobasidium torrendii FP15055 ss-10]|uniref:F-box domain-containing protein n=1 Tax=Cylindrobasidium torrendii FP15055 ss-10 TaxID=1314674 RepID=A0A0D7B9H9_9AGAR|nr:hypothetical protein CYLTODRAFT_491152 [Cylindrobasidium torrendii FP15055 ss-10]
MAQEQRDLSLSQRLKKMVIEERTTANSLPPEIKGLITRKLGNLSPSSLSSLGLVWKDAWHDIRTTRFESIEFVDSSTSGRRCWQLLSLLRSSPNVATYILRISVGSEICMGCRLGKRGGPGKDRKWLAEILVMASRLEALVLHNACPALMNDVSDELGFSSLRAAFRTSLVQSLDLSDYAFVTPADLLEFMHEFPSLNRLRFNSIPKRGAQLDSYLWQQPLPRHEQVTSFTIGYVSTIDVKFLDLVAREPILPNVTHFGLLPPSQLNFLPVVRRLLLRWPSLIQLNLPPSCNAFYPGQMHLQFPSTLTTLFINIDCTANPLNYWASTLYNNETVGRVIVRFDYWMDRLISRMPDTDAIARFDDALADRADYLDWQDVLIGSKRHTRDVPLQTARNWVCAVFPKVAKKFFAGMPSEPMSGVVYKGPFASRCNETVFTSIPSYFTT